MLGVLHPIDVVHIGCGVVTGSSVAVFYGVLALLGVCGSEFNYSWIKVIEEMYFCFNQSGSQAVSQSASQSISNI